MHIQSIFFFFEREVCLGFERKREREIERKKKKKNERRQKTKDKRQKKKKREREKKKERATFFRIFGWVWLAFVGEFELQIFHLHRYLGKHDKSKE